MFCPKCGTSLQAYWSICPKCGTPVNTNSNTNINNNINTDTSTSMSDSDNNIIEKNVSENKVSGNQLNQNSQAFQSNHMNQNYQANQNYQTGQDNQQVFQAAPPKKKKKKKIIIGCVVAFILLGIIGCFMDNTSGTNYTSTINQLKSITTVTADSDSYHFKNGNYWTITYSDVNEFAKIHESLITQSLSDWFGTKNLGCDSSFTYDFSENAIRIYLNYTSYEGTLSIINYDISNDEFILNANGDRYTASRDFESYLRRCGILQLIKSDIEAFKTDLSNNGLSYDKIKNIKYSDVKKVLN